MTLVFEGELDISTVRDAEAVLGEAERDGSSTTVFDLRGLSFMDSTGLRFVIDADERLRAAGRALLLIAGPEAVHRVFRMTLLDQRLTFIDVPANSDREEPAAGHPPKARAD